MATVYFDSPHDDNTRRESLYDGNVYVYSPNSASVELCEFAKQMCRGKFHPHNPPLAHRELSVEQYNQVLKQLKPEFIHHPRCKELLPKLLRQLGCPAATTYFDVPRLRTACPAKYLSSGLAYAFKPHRDTWYSTPMSQLNWWLPVYPIQTDNCMTFHLRYWDQPLRNSSAGFNYQDWNDVGRKQAHSQGKKDTRIQSEAVEPVELEPQIRLVCEPGSIIVFSAAHLHSTVPNTTDETRISIDFRTVNLNDLQTNRGAPNLDGESTGTTAGDYLSCLDGTHLPAPLIESCTKQFTPPVHPNRIDPNQDVSNEV